MGWFSFGKKEKKGRVGFRAVDWMDVEAKIRHLDAMYSQNDQAVAKQLLIQADMLVDQILKQGSCPGQNMGERLKSLNGSVDRSTLNMLWNLHKKRNELAHESGSFVADWEKKKYYEDAKEAISLIRGIR